MKKLTTIISFLYLLVASYAHSALDLAIADNDGIYDLLLVNDTDEPLRLDARLVSSAILLEGIDSSGKTIGLYFPSVPVDFDERKIFVLESHSKFIVQRNILLTYSPSLRKKLVRFRAVWDNCKFIYPDELNIWKGRSESRWIELSKRNNLLSMLMDALLGQKEVRYALKEMKSLRTEKELSQEDKDFLESKTEIDLPAEVIWHKYLEKGYIDPAVIAKIEIPKQEVTFLQEQLETLSSNIEGFSCELVKKAKWWYSDASVQIERTVLREDEVTELVLCREENRFFLYVAWGYTTER